MWAVNVVHWAAVLMRGVSISYIDNLRGMHGTGFSKKHCKLTSEVIRNKLTVVLP